jgi:enoyl-CoA hydratase/carnithine racemase
VYELFAGLPQPTVAAITGYCLGGGLEFALAADIRIADSATVFGFPEIDIGILPSSGGLTRIGRAVVAARARDLVLRGRRFGVEEAERWGLALRITKRVLDAPKEAALLLERLAYAVLNDVTPGGQV